MTRASDRLRRFVAVDFETANEKPESACAVGLVVVEGREIAEKVSMLIAPRQSRFRFANLHGIDRETVRAALPFGDAWARVESCFRGASFLVAHNAGFDRKVLYACCARASRSAPPLPFLCTLEMAKRLWPLTSYALPSVCAHLGIALQHHDPLSDAEAAARIALAAEAAGLPLTRRVAIGRKR